MWEALTLSRGALYIVSSTNSVSTGISPSLDNLQYNNKEDMSISLGSNSKETVDLKMKGSKQLDICLFIISLQLLYQRSVLVYLLPLFRQLLSQKHSTLTSLVHLAMFENHHINNF